MARPRKSENYAQKREEALEEMRAGSKYSDVAKRLNIHPSTARQWFLDDDPSKIPAPREKRRIARQQNLRITNEAPPTVDGDDEIPWWIGPFGAAVFFGGVVLFGSVLAARRGAETLESSSSTASLSRTDLTIT